MMELREEDPSARPFWSISDSFCSTGLRGFVDFVIFKGCSCNDEKRLSYVVSGNR